MMIKFILTLIGLFLVSVLAMQDAWKVTLIGFGYEVTLSAILLLIFVVVSMYVIGLIKSPFCWLKNYKKWKHDKQKDQKESLLLLALKSFLDGNEKNTALLLKQCKSLFSNKSDEALMIEAVFRPTPYLFEQLLHRPNTEMIGIRGLLNYAQESGDLNEVGRLLKRAIEKGAEDKWIYEALWKNQTMQSDWNDSLNTLEVLKKNHWVTTEKYTTFKSCLLLKLGQYAAAFTLNPNNPMAGILYAKYTPQKALSILTKSWEKNPCWETYLLFRETIKDAKPAKRIKLTEKLVRKNKEHRLAIMALAQAAVDAQMWGLAKEYLTTYFNVFPTTPTTAFLMAQVEREGWHHEEGALKWEKKATETKEIGGWGCSNCSHQTKEWEAICPTCNSIGTISYK